MNIGVNITKRTAMIFLLLLAAGTSLLGNWASSRLRPLAQTILLPPIEPLNDTALTVRDRFQNIGAPPRWQKERLEARRREDKLRQALEAERARFAEHLRIDHESKAMYGALGDPGANHWNVIWAKVAADSPLPYGDSRVLRTADGKAGAYVAMVDLLTNLERALPERLVVADSRLAHVPPGTSDLVMVGQLVSSGAATAQMRLITDSQFQMQAKIHRDPNRPREIETDTRKTMLTSSSPGVTVQLRGDGKGGLFAAEVRKGENIMAGDWVVSSRTSALVPEGLRIGWVVGIKPNPKNPILVSVIIRPMADLAAMREVFILLPRDDGGGN